MHAPKRSVATSIALLVTAALLAACEAELPPARSITADPAFCAQIQHASAKLSAHLAPFDSLMRTSTGVYALEEGDVSMVARAWLTEAAERTIDVQYFIFTADNIGLIAVDYLLRAANRGIRVRLLVDDFMVKADAEALLALDAHPNLEIRLYNPSTNIGKKLPAKILNLTTDFRGFNQRMHNKTFIVDGQAVITGGRNIADEYFDYDHAYNFRDRDVLLLGGASVEVQRSFDLFWEDALSAPIASLVQPTVTAPDTATVYRYLHNYACDPANFWPQVRERIKSVPVAFDHIRESGALVWSDSVTFVTDAPGKNAGTDGLGGGGASTDELIRLIKGAQKSVTIQSPYLVTTGLSQGLFREVIARGVRVRILTNSLASTDNLEAFSGYQRERNALLAIGVEIYEFKPDAAVRRQVMTGALQTTIDYAPTFGLHAKSMVVDDNVAVIGTFNLDPRSANLNTECIVVARDARVAGDLARAMDADMRPENAWHTTAEFNPDGSVGIGKRIKVWFRRVVPKAVL
ncbi:MAG: phospholipase D family protein [Phycisphaerae bacterium]|nr:phospholipase D family protein [Gemmatimonadaceae bacterium]